MKTIDTNGTIKTIATKKVIAFIKKGARPPFFVFFSNKSEESKISQLQLYVLQHVFTYFNGKMTQNHLFSTIFVPRKTNI
jgi:hypothetical protein